MKPNYPKISSKKVYTTRRMNKDLIEICVDRDRAHQSIYDLHRDIILGEVRNNNGRLWKHRSRI